MSDDTPTQRFDTPAPQGDGDPEKKKSRALMIALIIVGAVLMIALIILVVVLAARGAGSSNADASTTASASDTPSDTPSVTPSATPTPTPTPTPTQTVAPPPPPPPSNNPTINSFKTGSTTVLCNESAPEGDHQPIGFSWSTSKAAKVYFGVDTNDASTASLFDNLPASGNSNDDFPDGYNHGTYEYPCTALSTKFTLTVVGDNGHKASKSITIVNHGDH